MPKLLRCALLLLVLAGASASSAEAATTAQRLVTAARTELGQGIREMPDGSNRGPGIRKYLTSTTPSAYGGPWCAYFVSYLAKRSGVPIGPGGRGLAYVPYIRSWAKSTRRWRTRPRPGYLVTWAQHVGIVESVSANGTMTTIEGNSANAVRRRHRRSTDAMGFVALAAGGPIGVGRPARPKPPRPAVATPPLQARITLYPGATVHLGDRLELSANDSSGDVQRARWDFDADGRFDDAKGDSASLRVRRTGRFEVALRVFDAKGRSSTARTVVTVLGHDAPSARLHLPARTVAGRTITADASRSLDPSGQGLRFEWDLDGDGTYVAGAAQEPATFTTPGVHRVGLRVVAADGQVDETLRLVAVLPDRRVPDAEPVEPAGPVGPVAPVVPAAQPPTVVVDAPATATVGVTAWLDASRSSDPDGRVRRIRWDVGADGRWDAKGPRLRLTPSEPGPLRVLVEVRDDDGITATAEVVVDVRAAEPEGDVADDQGERRTRGQHRQGRRGRR